MTNKERLIKALKKDNYKLGCYDNKIEKLSYNQIKKIIDNIGYGSTDILVSLNRKKYIVEVSEVEDELDFSIISLPDYVNQYGRNPLEED